MPEPPERHIDAIVREMRSGRDFEANFQKLFQLTHAQIYRFFQRKGVPDDECLDLTQDTFVSVYKGLEELRDESQFMTWLFVIARHTFGNYLDRKHAIKRKAIVVPLLKSAGGDGDSTEREVMDERDDALSDLVQQEKVMRLREALLDLPEQMRRCVMMRVTEDAPYDQIAARFGISPNTVKVHLHNARKGLARRLKPWFGEINL
jgi:RNA polymerase sigma-70 factor, ECF subfamily